MNSLYFKKIFMVLAVISLTVGSASAQDSASNYSSAAQGGDKTAQYNLALCFSGGIGTDKDETKAVYWLGKSAMQGHSRAQSRLGVHYSTGIGVEADKNKALYWFERAEKNEDGSFRGTFIAGFTKTYIDKLKSEGFSSSRANFPSCSACRGTGSKACSVCNGTKQIKWDEGYTIPGYGIIPDIHMPPSYAPCLACNMTGKVSCTTCDGSGKNITVVQTAAQSRPTTPASTPQPAPAPANSDFEISGTTLVKYNGSSTNVTIPSNVTVIGKDAFKSKNLTSVTIPNNVTSIGDWAFSYNKLTSVTIPNSVTSIGSYAFSNNDLANVTIPNSVTSIGGSSFSLNKLTSVTIPNSVTSIGSLAFSNNGLTSVNIPKSVTSIGTYAFHCERLTSIEAAPDNAYFSSEGGILYNKDKTKLIIYPRGKSSGGTYNIPNNVISIETSAFNDCKLSGIVIPNSVTSIGSYAFSGNNLTSVTIPVSVTSIGGSAFAYNDQLNSVTIDANVKIGTGVFSRFNEKRDIVNSGFEEFYEKNGKKAGTYTYDGKNWNFVTAPAQPAASPAPANVNPNFIPPSLWKTVERGQRHWDSPGVTKRFFNTREVIAGQERDVLTMEVTFTRQTNNGGTSKWGGFVVKDESIVSKLRMASGVRFKALGDGKRWVLIVDTNVTEPGDTYRAEIKTTNNRVVDINIPFSSLKQGSWVSSRRSFVKNNIISILIQRHTDTASETGASTLKVFDFEIY